MTFSKLPTFTSDAVLVTPTAASLNDIPDPQLGDIRFVEDEDAIYAYTSGGWAEASGGGDVSGPGSSTDNALVRWDGTGGTATQNSGVLIDDSNNMSGVGTLSVGGALDMSNNVINNVTNPTTSQQAATKDYVDSLVGGLDWQQSVLSGTTTATPGSPSTGDRYLVPSAGVTGDWVGNEDSIAEYNGSSWDYTAPQNGMAVNVEDTGKFCTYNGSAWVNLSSAIDHNSTLGKQGGGGGDFYHSDQPINTTDDVGFNSVGVGDGTVSAPSIKFTNSSDTGFYILPNGAPAMTVDATLIAAWNLANFLTTVPYRSTQNGSNVLPTYSFSDAPTTGMYKNSFGNVAFTVDGTDVANFSTNWVTLNESVRGVFGSAGTPTYTFNGDSNTGMYRDSSNTLAFATSGTLRMTVKNDRITADVPYWGQDGSATAPTYAFEGATQTGLYTDVNDYLNMTVSGTAVVSINPFFNRSIPRYVTDTLNLSFPSYSFTGQGDSGMTLDPGGTYLALVKSAAVKLRAYADRVEMPDVVRAGNGSSTTPSYSFINSTGSGMYWESAGGGSLFFSRAGTVMLGVLDNSTISIGDADAAVSLTSRDAAGANNSGALTVKSGDQTGTANSGNLDLEIGSAAGGTRGDIRLRDGSEGASGEYWQSKGTGGEGNWAVLTAPSFTDGTRPAASTVGQVIFNTDDNTLNVADGTNWRDMTGAIT